MNKLRSLGGLCLLLLFPVAHADYTYDYYEGDWSVLPNFDRAHPRGYGLGPRF